MNAFQSKKILGSGSFGRVYLVRDEAGTESVVKEVRLNSKNEKLRKQALEEVRLLSQIQHFNIVRWIVKIKI